ALVVGCYRDVELGRDHPLSHAVAELERGQATRVLRLGGLASSEIERLVELRLDSAAPPGVVAAIERRTRGNPLFVGEVCRLLEAEPAAIEDEDALARRMAMPRGV